MLLLLNDRIKYQLTLVLFLFSFKELHSRDQTEVPRWYLKPPENTEKYCYGAGISQITYDNSISYENAKKNASEEIVKSIKVNLRASYAGSQGIGLLESAIFAVEGIDSSLVEKIASNAIVLRELIHENNVYILICVSRDYAKPKNKIAVNLPLVAYDIPSKEKIPSWVEKMPSKKGFLYGISNTEPFESQKESWKYSSKMARYEIAAQMNSDIKTITEEYVSGNQVVTRTLSEVNVNQILQNTVIKGRWHDKSDYRYWTLIEYRLKD